MAGILLVNPPFYRLWGSHYNGMMLGIASLTAVLREAGHDCWMLNADFEPHDNYLPTRQIHDNATGASGWMPPREQLHKEIVAAILSFAPDWVGYSCFSANYGEVAAIAAAVGIANPSIRQIIGGPHAAVDDDAAERMGYIRHQFRGEAEESLVAAIANHAAAHKTITSSRIENLDKLPFIDRTHWWSLRCQPMQEGELSHVNVCYISTARGCPYCCAFCAAPRLWSRKVTYRSVEHVLREWRLLNGIDVSPQADAIHVVDDTFTFNKPRALKIMQGLVDEWLCRPWKCESRADAIDAEIADAMKRSGCIRVKIGFESGSVRMLEQLRKQESKDQMRQAVRILKDRGIAVTGYWIAGYPGETDDDLRQTIDFAKSLNLDTYSLNMFAPYPGSLLHEMAHGEWNHFVAESPEALFGQSRVREINPNLSESLLEEYWALDTRSTA